MVSPILVVCVLCAYGTPYVCTWKFEVWLYQGQLFCHQEPKSLQVLGPGFSFTLKVSKDKLHQVTPRYIKFIIAMIWLCLCLTCADFSKGRMFKLCESYPKKSRLWMFLLGSFGIALASLGPNPMIPGYLHIPSRNGESSPCAQSLIISPKLAGSGWLAGWGWVAG